MSCLPDAPTGYVANGDDCDDNNPNGKVVGQKCFTGCDCDTFIDPACFCATTDGDNDGVCDGIDVCPFDDDKIDMDGNGVPDCVENCAGVDAFDVTFLRTDATNSSASASK